MTANSPIFTMGKKLLGAWAIKYATAIIPESTKDVTRVQRPMTMRIPPINSNEAVNPPNEKSCTPSLYASVSGNLKSFVVPCSRNSSPVITRRMAWTKPSQESGIVLTSMRVPFRIDQGSSTPDCDNCSTRLKIICGSKCPAEVRIWDAL